MSKYEEKITKGRERWVGESRLMNCKMLATITEYFSASNITVQFEDGYVVANKTITGFKRGQILNPNAHAKGYEGLSLPMKNGMTATIVKYNGSGDITVRFEDGEIVEHKSMSNFRKGLIRNPRITSHLMEERQMSCGLTAKVIAYRSRDDIDVEFSDGYIATRKSYANFYRGTIANPNEIGGRLGKNMRERIGMIGVSKEGIPMKLIEYRKCSDVDVLFPDGTKVFGKSYYDFIRQDISHPRFSYRSRNRNFFGFEIIREIFRLNEESYFFVLNLQGERDVLTFDEMLECAGRIREF